MYNSSSVKRIRSLILTVILSGVIFSAYSINFQVQDSARMMAAKDSLNSKAAKDSANLKVPKDTTGLEKRELTVEDIIRGERLFYGLVYTGNKSVNCAGCHNTRVPDTLNWNPDAVEISLLYLKKNTNDLSRVLLKPAGVKMAQVHKGFQFTREDIILIKAFMDRIPGIGLKKDKPTLTNLIILILASLLFLIASADLIIRKIFKKTAVNWLIISLTGIVITWILAVNAIAFGRARGYTPFQPIKFSHAVHAGQNKTECLYCHSYANYSKSAGIPAGSVCMNCHLMVRTGTRSGVTEINKVRGAFENGTPVRWIRVYHLPDFVFFSHAQHTGAGGLDCTECHGKVKEMDVLQQVPDLSMGWCIKCHDSRKVNLTNGYYKSYYPEFYNAFREGKLDSVMVARTGGRNCGSCHY